MTGNWRQVRASQLSQHVPTAAAQGIQRCPPHTGTPGCFTHVNVTKFTEKGDDGVVQRAGSRHPSKHDLPNFPRCTPTDVRLLPAR